MPEGPSDRKLGDSWIDWKGEDLAPEKVRAGKRLFLALLAASLLLALAASALLLYLVSPRLAQFSRRLPHLASALLAALALMALLWLALALLVTKTPNRFFCLCLGNRFFFELSSLATALGARLGLSRDRVGHSFIKVSNAIMLASVRGRKAGRILVLLPRCLSKEARKEVLGICSRYQVTARTAGGGEEARRLVQEERPEAVVGIACERDLVSGIQEVAPRIPVVGIPNIRPEGPCKGTHIKGEDLAEALELLGASPACGEGPANTSRAASPPPAR